jgi:hypothetical protein
LNRLSPHARYLQTLFVLGRHCGITKIAGLALSRNLQRLTLNASRNDVLQFTVCGARLAGEQVDKLVSVRRGDDGAASDFFFWNSAECGSDFVTSSLCCKRSFSRSNSIFL